VLKLEEYIEKRKTEDGINEFDSSQKMNHIRTCINYIFEYFDQYLPLQGIEKRTVYQNEKLQKYEKALRDYSPDVREWLLNIYDTYEKQANRIIASYLSRDEEFFLMYEEAEFRALSYDCYASLIKKNPFLKNQTELLYKFIREYHIWEANKYAFSIPEVISSDITRWLKSTLEKYNVNIAMAIEQHVSGFYNSEIVSSDGGYKQVSTKYNYKKKTNLFDINTYYSRFSQKPFIRGKKKQLEILMMYIWLNSIIGDEDGYWNEYINRFQDY